MRTSCALNNVETPECLQSTVSMLMRFTNTDAIRMKASRAASARGEDGAVNYNPFARVPSRKQSDVENHAYRTRSEAQVQPTLEEQRRLESRQTEKEFPAPHHAGTAPTVSPTSVNGTENAHHSALGKETETFGPNASASKESGEASDNTAIDHDHSILTKRAKFKHIFRKSHDGEENEELGRVETEGLSFEERKKRAHRKKIPVGAQFQWDSRSFMAKLEAALGLSSSSTSLQSFLWQQCLVMRQRNSHFESVKPLAVFLTHLSGMFLLISRFSFTYISQTHY
jgi:hypothetical protein